MTFTSTATQATLTGLPEPVSVTTSSATLSGTFQIDTTGTARVPFVEVRCPRCGKLICKWEFTGIASLEIKCTRCGSINVIRLSTM